MEPHEDKEEEVHCSKTTPCDEHESQRKEPEPEPSCLSFKSDHSKDAIIRFKPDQPSDAQRKEPEPEPSCLSFKSDHSKDAIIRFKPDQPSDAQRFKQSSEEGQPHHDPLQLDSIFMELEEKVVTYVKNELKNIKRSLSSDGPDYFESQEEDESGYEDKKQRSNSRREAFLKIILDFLRMMKKDDLADTLQSKSVVTSQQILKFNLKNKVQTVFEGIANSGKQILLNQIYIELYITEGATGKVNNEHEFRLIEEASCKPQKPEKTIRHGDIFKTLFGKDKPIRTVMTKGVAGIGKTVLTKKFTLDWAEDQANKDIQFMFPFTFRELNLIKEQQFSLVELVHHFFSETKGIYSFEELKVVFIFEGLDECRFPLDFHDNEILTDVTKSTSVDVLLTNLIRGKLLPSAHLWITTRPAAASRIPTEFVSIMTEIRGFTDPQKDEYFTKRFRYKRQANMVISHVKKSRSLHIMCHIPIFCWITAAVVEDMLSKKEELPNTLTELYIHFLVVQAKVKKLKYVGGSETDSHWSPESKKMIECLGKLAFEQLLKGNLIFYESDLMDCGIDVQAASLYSGVVTQIFQEEKGLYYSSLFCFIHLSVQEILAALHVHLTFIKSGVNLLAQEEMKSKGLEKTNNESSEIDIYTNAVDMAMERQDGHLDLFLRFLLGLSLDTNRCRLRGLVRQTGESSATNKDTAQYIKEKINNHLSVEKSINLFHCLNELNDPSLVEEIQQSLSTGSLSGHQLSAGQWSALFFILLSSDQHLEIFDLKKYSSSDDGLQRLLPIFEASRKAILSGCNLSERSCVALSSALSSRAFSLRELDLSNNNLGDSGVKLLCDGLKSQHCKLENLRLSGCLIKLEGFVALASALTINHSHLREVDLSYNHPGEEGIQALLAAVDDADWKQKTLKVEPTGVEWLTPGLKKYSCSLTVDLNSISKRLKLSEDHKKVTREKEEQLYPDHPERFDLFQLLCSNCLTGRCYWEVEWSGRVDIAVSYRTIKRKGESNDCWFGFNDRSWSLICSDDGYTVWNDKKAVMDFPSSSSCFSASDRVAVYVDCPAGTLSFYRVSSDTLIHLYTFSTTFTEPLYPGFGFEFRHLERKAWCSF